MTPRLPGERYGTPGKADPRELWFSRRIADGVTWFGGCNPAVIGGREFHGHVSCYLVRGTKRSLLFDTGYLPQWPMLEAALDRALGGRQLDYIVPSHPELPHAGNLGRLLRKYPDALALGELRDYHLYHPDQSKRMSPRAVGARIKLGGGFRFTFVEAVIRDLPNTVWGYERRSRVMFTSDGFLYLHNAESVHANEPLHRSSECWSLTSELPRLPALEVTAYSVASGHYPARYHDSAATFDRLRALFERYPANLVAPTHGNVVSAADITELSGLAIETFRLAYEKRRTEMAAAGIRGR